VLRATLNRRRRFAGGGSAPPAPCPLPISAFPDSPGCGPFASRPPSRARRARRVAPLSRGLIATMGRSDSSSGLGLRWLALSLGLPASLGPVEVSLGHALIPSHRADAHLPDGLSYRASPSLASSPTRPAVSAFALRFGPVFAAGPSPPPLAGRQLPSMCSWLRRPIFRTSTSGGTSTRWMNAPRGARARGVPARWIGLGWRRGGGRSLSCSVQDNREGARGCRVRAASR